jgi:CheY-like chemotaxis protein
MIANVLIVDDSGVSRKVTRKCLEFSGLAQCVFNEAENGERALEVLERVPIDLLVTDLNMPLMDGLELLRAIDGIEQYRDLIKIVATSAASESLEAELRKHGVAAMFAKPLTPAAVGKVMAECLRKERTP